MISLSMPNTSPQATLPAHSLSELEPPAGPLGLSSSTPTSPSSWRLTTENQTSSTPQQTLRLASDAINNDSLGGAQTTEDPRASDIPLSETSLDYEYFADLRQEVGLLVN